MGFQEQMTEILSRLQDTRQTMLFSATLPKLLVEFAKAGLHDPVLCRIDLDTKLSDQLKVKTLFPSACGMTIFTFSLLLGIYYLL